MNAIREFNLGVDLAQASFEAAIAPRGAQLGHWPELSTISIDSPPDSADGIRRLRAWLREQCPGATCARVVVESTGKLSRRFARALDGRGLPPVIIVNPRRTKAFGDSLGVRDKTDRIDAAILAMYAKAHRPKPKPQPSAAQEQLCELTRLREVAVQDRTAWGQCLGESESPAARKMIMGMIKNLDKKVK